ncbi:hypothetical protein L9G74_18515 [Shewanella sp. C32]|uniref:Uncharacterized protein n=1 Tax=Shewanella electrica TaxID=515560 RepID=A0ABT2FQ20_9GAMM|nr:hypothetical protein [Shewanella electrica]MCH1925739.1 hypothetical protein [Shewanella electrica]MCS4558434.1 hypothetical protein [Shewanella electrica]
MKIVKKQEFPDSYTIEPALPAYQQALSLFMMQNYAHLERFVTHTLRRQGCGVDYTGSYYACEVTEDEQDEYDIAAGHVEISCSLDEPPYVQLLEADYVEILAQVCDIRDLPERAALLRRFNAEPQLADSLLEASPSRCHQRWRQFIPFMQQYCHWHLKDGRLYSPDEKAFYSVDAFTDDLEVMYRVAQHTLQQLQQPSTPHHFPEYVAAQIPELQHRLQALQAYFAWEQQHHACP